jgi:hypothetical protein
MYALVPAKRDGSNLQNSLQTIWPHNAIRQLYMSLQLAGTMTLSLVISKEMGKYAHVRAQRFWCNLSPKVPKLDLEPHPRPQKGVRSCIPVVPGEHNWLKQQQQQQQRQQQEQGRQQQQKQQVLSLLKYRKIAIHSAFWCVAATQVNRVNSNASPVP